MSTLPKTFLTPEPYLEIERKADFQSEYYQGGIFAVTGAQEAHNLLVGNLLFVLKQQLRSRQCRVYSNDMRSFDARAGGIRRRKIEEGLSVYLI